jgi:putative glutamine amidotransferase
MPTIAIAPCRQMADYVESIRRAGAAVAELTVGEPPEDVVKRVDGVLLTGGGDLDPALYGAEPHATFEAAEPGRDAFDIALVKAAVAANLPVLAICRGMQVLNVARGGALIQHLPEAVGHKGHAPETGIVGAHRVQISATSLVGKILGDSADVPTYHHQAVSRLGKGLSAVAWAEDQVVEAVELQGHRFGLAVQWHPEEGDDKRLFEALVAEAADR